MNKYNFSGRTLVHDSYNCVFLRLNYTKGFPTRRNEYDPNNFVGSITQYLDDPEPMLDECPLPCRPPDHQDWLYCWKHQCANYLGNTPNGYDIFWQILFCLELATLYFLLGSMYLFMVQRHWQGTSRLTFGKITEIIQFILLSIDTKIEMPKKRSKILITRNVITGTYLKCTKNLAAIWS